VTEASEAASPPSKKSESPNTSILARNREFKRFAKFFVVGTMGAVIDGGTFNALNALGWLAHIELDLPIGFTLTGLGISGAIAFTLAVSSNFIWNRYWIYPDSRSKSVVGQLITFFLVNTVGIVIRIPILELLSGPFGALWKQLIPVQSFLSPDLLGKNSAWALAVIVVMLWNFFVNRYWTYSDVK